MSREEKTTKMLALVDKFRASGITQKQFAQEHGIPVSVLHYWLSKSHQENTEVGFLQIDCCVHPEFRIIYPSGIEIHIPSQTSIPLIKQLTQL